MGNKEALQLFGEKKIRTAWNQKEEKWYFSIVDIVEVLTDSPDPAKYWRVLKTRLKKEGSETATNCSTFKMMAADARENIEKRVGASVVTSLNAKNKPLLETGTDAPEIQ